MSRDGGSDFAPKMAKTDIKAATTTGISNPPVRDSESQLNMRTSRKSNADCMVAAATPHNARTTRVAPFREYDRMSNMVAITYPPVAKTI